MGEALRNGEAVCADFLQILSAQEGWARQLSRQNFLRGGEGDLHWAATSVTRRSLRPSSPSTNALGSQTAGVQNVSWSRQKMSRCLAVTSFKRLTKPASGVSTSREGACSGVPRWQAGVAPREASSV